MQTSNRTALIVLACCLLFLVFGEYCFIEFLTPSPKKWYSKILSFYEKGGLFIRLLTGLILMLIWVVPDDKKLRKEMHTKEKEQEKYITFSALPIYLISLLLVTIAHKFQVVFNYIFIPFSLIAISGFFVGKAIRPKRKRFELETDKKANNKTKDLGFTLELIDGSFFNIANPFRGNVIMAGAGGGKSEMIKLILKQGIEKKFAILNYDVKFPELTEGLYYHWARQKETPLSLKIVNFRDLTRSHRVNPLAPRYIESSAHAQEYILSFINALNPETTQKKDFWIRSCVAVMTGALWYLKKHAPHLCSIPHLVCLFTLNEYEKVIKVISQDDESLAYVRSLVTAMNNKASDQIAGVMGTLQLTLAPFVSKEIFWVLSKDDVNLTINDAKKPQVLSIGADPTLMETVPPLASVIFTVGMKMMNQPGRQKSMLMIDEAPTIYIPKLETIPATARSNKVAVFYCCQDKSQMELQNGAIATRVILANLNNQFFGRVAEPTTTKYISELFGKYDEVMYEESRESASLSLSLDNKQRTRGKTISSRTTERNRVNTDDVTTFDTGEFLGLTVETDNPAGFGKIKVSKDQLEGKQRMAIPVLMKNISESSIETNFNKILEETRAFIESNSID